MTLKIELTNAEIECLMALLRHAANEPSDVDADTFESLLDKFDKATL